MQRFVKIGIIFGVLLCGYLALPFCFGSLAQHYSTKFVDNSNKTVGKVLGLHFELTQYHRGWFHSQAILQISNTAADGNQEIIQSVPITIEHGPTYRLNGRTHMGVGGVSSPSVTLKPEVAYQLFFHDNISFSGERAVLMLLSNQTAQSQFPVQVRALSLGIASDLKAQHFHFTLKGSDLRYQDPQHAISLTIKTLNADLLASYLADRHWQSVFSLGLQNNQLTSIISNATGAPSPVTLNLADVSIQHVHLDTQALAKFLGDLVQLKNAANKAQPARPFAWAALIQELLTQLINTDTQMSVQGFSLTTPMGQAQLQYDVSFPALPQKHDYFDLATMNVGELQLSVPHWIYTNPQNNIQFALTNFHYRVSSNTVFSRRSRMEIGALDVTNLQTGHPATFSANGFLYHGEVTGDPYTLSQVVDWKIAKICAMGGCFQNVRAEFQFLHLSYAAFRGIATATQQLVQQNPGAQPQQPAVLHWLDLANAYIKLVTPTTQIIFANDMQTPQGQLTMNANVSWPSLKIPENTTLTTHRLFHEAHYTAHLLFPAAYADALLEDAQSVAIAAKNPNGPVTAATENQGPPFEVQAAQFLRYVIAQGYLKKVGNGYVADLSGKGSVVSVNGKPWQAPTDQAPP